MTKGIGIIFGRGMFHNLSEIFRFLKSEEAATCEQDTRFCADQAESGSTLEGTVRLLADD